MGCCAGKASDVGSPKPGGKPKSQADKDHELARQLQREEDRNARATGSAAAPKQKQPGWDQAGQGQALGGAPGADSTANLSAEERRQRVLEAAEKRQNDVKGIAPEKVVQMRERAAKDDYLAKIHEYYHHRKIDMPMGLNAATAEQLKKHWEGLRKGATNTDQVLEAQ